MATRNLTDVDVKSAKPGTHVIRLRDGKVKGLHLVIHPHGAKAWGLSYTSPEVRATDKDGNTRRDPDGRPIMARRNITLGQYPGVSLATARRRAGKKRNQIDDGIDPKEEERRQEEAKAAEEGVGTVRQLFDTYTKDLELDGKRSAKQISGALDLNSGSIVNMKAKDVTREHIADIIAEVATRAPVQANRVRTYLHAAFAFGLDCRTRPRWRKKAPDFQLTHNPVTLTKKAAKEQVGQRYLSKEEVKAMWNSIGVDALSADLAIALKLILSTGQRVEEVLHATWSEFDEEEKLWTIPGERRKTRGKTSEPHLVPLTEFHVELLEELKPLSSSKYLFPHKDCDDPEKKDRPRGADALSQAVHRFCIPAPKSTRKPFPKFVPKDLRRTWKTLAGSIGISLEMRNRIQGHALRDVGSMHYDRWDYLEEKRGAMEIWSSWLDEVITGKQAKVVKLQVAT